jgi:hypothetical protein
MLPPVDDPGQVFRAALAAALDLFLEQFQLVLVIAVHVISSSSQGLTSKPKSPASCRT